MQEYQKSMEVTFLIVFYKDFSKEILSALIETGFYSTER